MLQGSQCSETSLWCLRNRKDIWLQPDASELSSTKGLQEAGKKICKKVNDDQCAEEGKFSYLLAGTVKGNVWLFRNENSKTRKQVPNLSAALSHKAELLLRYLFW